MKCSFRMQYDDVITNSRWQTNAILKIVFWLYLGAILADQREIWCRDEGSHADIGHVTKTAVFRKFKMADGRHFENRIISISQPWIIRFRSNLVSRCTFQFPWWAFNQKNRNFSNSRWRTDAILNIVFDYISAPYGPINAKFGKEMKNHMPIQITWPKLQFFPNSRWRKADILCVCLLGVECQLSNWTKPSYQNEFIISTA